MALGPLICVALLVGTSMPARTAPFVPAADDQVLEQLPFALGDPTMRELRVLRTRRRSTPGHGCRSRAWQTLVNELIITTPFKDGWNAAEPENEADFQAFYTNPVVATELNLVFGVPILPIDGSSAKSRTDLMSLLLKYPGQALNGTNCGHPCAELLRLDLRVPPTAPENQSRLGAALSADNAGYPNGRRPNDDVTDIAVRVVGGTNYINARIGDGVNFLAGAPGVVGVDITTNGIARNFPFLPTPYDGKNRVHVDCGETGPGGNPCGKLVP